MLNRWSNTSCRLLRKITLSIMGLTEHICYPLTEICNNYNKVVNRREAHSPSSATAPQHTTVVGKAFQAALRPVLGASRGTLTSGTECQSPCHGR